MYIDETMVKNAMPDDCYGVGCTKMYYRCWFLKVAVCKYSYYTNHTSFGGKRIFIEILVCVLIPRYDLYVSSHRDITWE